MRRFVFYLPLLFVLLTLSACETVKGAAGGMKKDIESLSAPDSPINKADAWMQEHMW